MCAAVYLFDFSKNRSKASAQYTDSPIHSISFNKTGDKILFGAKNGDLVVSNFEYAKKIVDKPIPGTSVDWINGESQFVIADGDGISIVDHLVGSTVATYYHNLPHTRRRPIAVYGPNVAVGTSTGVIEIFDIRTGKIFQSLAAHVDEVRALKYDVNGNFLISGSLDNSVCIINSSSYTELNSIPAVLGDNSSKRGVLTIALSNQVIVTGGYSPYIHTWTVSEPQALNY